MQPSQSEAARRHMIDSQLRTSGINSPWIIAAMGSIAREDFLPADKAAFAYQDRSVPLGNGRMQSPPLATAQMLQAAEVSGDDDVLVIGSATGYLAALLATRARKTTSVEADTTKLEAFVHSGTFSLILIDGAIEQLPETVEALLAEGGRVVTGLAEGPITRLAIGTKHGGRIALRPFADLEVAPLPGFARAKEFIF